MMSPPISISDSLLLSHSCLDFSRLCILLFLHGLKINGGGPKASGIGYLVFFSSVFFFLPSFLVGFGLESWKLNLGGFLFSFVQVVISLFLAYLLLFLWFRMVFISCFSIFEVLSGENVVFVHLGFIKFVTIRKV